MARAHFVPRGADLEVRPCTPPSPSFAAPPQFPYRTVRLSQTPLQIYIIFQDPFPLSPEALFIFPWIYVSLGLRISALLKFQEHRGTFGKSRRVHLVRG
jgi:hypothetical protein